MSKTIKLKEPSVQRTYDNDGFRKRAACICVNGDETKVLLVTSRKDDSQWIVPGGGVEPDEEVAMAAVREVQEEAGVLGNLGRCLGVFENAERGHRTSVFVLEVTEELDEWDESRTFGRQRQWFTVEAAVAALHKPVQSNYVRLLLPAGHQYHTQPPQPHIGAPLQPPQSASHQPHCPHRDALNCDSNKPSNCNSSDNCIGRRSVQDTKDRDCSLSSGEPLEVVGSRSSSKCLVKGSSNAVVLDPLCSQEQCTVVGSTMTAASISTG